MCKFTCLPHTFMYKSLMQICLQKLFSNIDMVVSHEQGDNVLV